MFSSFHHFRATDARKVLANAVERRKGIAIFEMARREPKIILAICFIPFLILFLTLRIRPFRWSRLLWTYGVPIVPFVLWFDGLMSCLCSDSHEELGELVQSLPEENYRWAMRQIHVRNICSWIIRPVTWPPLTWRIFSTQNPRI